MLFGDAGAEQQPKQECKYSFYLVRRTMSGSKQRPVVYEGADPKWREKLQDALLNRKVLLYKQSSMTEKAEKSMQKDGAFSKLFEEADSVIKRHVFDHLNHARAESYAKEMDEFLWCWQQDGGFNEERANHALATLNALGDYNARQLCLRDQNIKSWVRCIGVAILSRVTPDCKHVKGVEQYMTSPDEVPLLPLFASNNILFVAVAS